MATKAVYLEVSDYLMQDSFIHACRRFLTVRGQNMIDVFSDNSTNFTDASKILCLMIAKFAPGKLCRELCNRGVTWDISSVHASHVNGIVEGVIRVVHLVIEALLGSAINNQLTFE